MVVLDCLDALSSSGIGRWLLLAQVDQRDQTVSHKPDLQTQNNKEKVLAVIFLGTVVKGVNVLFYRNLDIVLFMPDCSTRAV